MNTFKDRLLSLFEADAKPSRIANAIDMSLPGFMRLYNDGFIPKAEGLIKIQEVTGCNLNWLLTGIGQPLLTDTEQNEVVIVQVAPLRSKRNHGIRGRQGRTARKRSSACRVPGYGTGRNGQI